MIKSLFNSIKNTLKTRAKISETSVEPVAETTQEPVKKKAGRPKKTAAPAKKAAPKKKTA